jgi:uncharacterized delta-60 repeat protein
MTTNYKILGQELNRLVYTCPENTNTIISKLKIKNTSYPANVDISIGPSSSYSFSNVYTTILDSNFSNANNTTDQSISSFGVQSDGKIIVGGAFDTIGGISIRGLARLNLDGTVDQSFNTISTNDGFQNTNFRKVIVLPNDKILVCGWNTLDTAPANTSDRIALLNSDGTLDTSYSISINQPVYDMFLQPDGKLIIIGPFTNVGGLTRNYIARLNSDGSQDTTFRSNAPQFNGSLTQIYTQSDGKIIVAGLFELDARIRTVRLNSDGTLDNSYTFNTPFGATNAIQELPDGRILMGGNYGEINGTNPGSYLVLTDSSGTLDNTFTIVENSIVFQIKYVPNLGTLYSNRVVNKINLSLTEKVVVATSQAIGDVNKFDLINSDYFYQSTYKMYKTKQDLVSSTIMSASSNDTYLVKNKEISFDETIEFNGGIALEEGQILLVDTPNGEDVIIQAYGIEETA